MLPALLLALFACDRPTPKGVEAADSAPRVDSARLDSAAASQRVLITELMASNDDTLLDADGDSSDWVELYNPGPDPVSLEGWGLSDDPDEADPWRFPARTLLPGGFLLVFASGKDASADPEELHAPFRLSADGEQVLLTDANGALVDQLTFGPQREDVSFGRAQAVETERLVQDGDPARLSYVEEAGWAEAAHDDGAWEVARLPVGFDVSVAEGEPESLSLGAHTEQSSDGYSRTGAQAVDGDLNTFSHTGDGDLAPWWQVDLGQRAELSELHILNRVGCCPERLYNMTARVLDSDGSEVWASALLNPTEEGQTPTDPGETLDVGMPSGLLGRYVRLEKQAVNGVRSSEWLSLAEVEVIGAPAAPYAGRIETALSPADAVWLRVALPERGSADRLTLHVRYDDALIVLSDDRALAALNVSGGQAAGPHDGTLEESWTLDPAGLGEVLALQLLNVDAEDPDLYLGLRLEQQRITTGALAWFDLPTPGAPNGLGYLGLVEAPRVEPPRGFYEDPQAVTLSSATPGATLIYTLDGSAPSWEHGTQILPADADTPPQGTIEVADTSLLRVLALHDDYIPGPIATHSYLFLDSVLRQPVDPAGFPATWDGLSQAPIAADYAMDPDIVDDPTYADALLAGLRDIPTLSLVTAPEDLFGEDAGIYIHSQQRGEAWERPVSVELILPDGSTGFQVDAGVRVHGYGWRPHSNTKKHSLRLEFRSRYGPSKLEWPLFEDAPVERFDSIVLRAQGSRSWQDFRDPEQAQYIRDAFARDTARDMGKVDGHATYVHLYLNGLYWGLYMPVERPDADFGAEYFGGEAEEYDAINRRTSTNEAIDGDLEAWTTLQALADADLSAQASYDAVTEMIDVDDLIDYMLIHQYTSNRDGPANQSNNMRCVRRRLEGERFRCFVWDMEYSLWYATDHINVEVDVPTSVSHVYAQMRANADFRARYAERAAMHLTGDGALTPGACLARYEARAEEIERAVIAESARWGDVDREPPYTRDVEWAAERQRLVEEYFPYRTDVLIGQLQDAGLYSR